MSVVRKLAFSAVATLLGLAALEGVARMVEAALPAPRVPLPSPAGAQCADCLPGAAGLDEDSMSPAVRLVWSERTGTWHALADDATRKDSRHEIRGTPPDPDRPPQAVELLTLGDSTVWGHGVGVDQVFSSVATQTLEAAWGRPVHATIGAQPGHTSTQSTKVFSVLAPQVDPDIVLIANLWSDLFHHHSPAFLDAPGASAPSALYRVLLRLLSPALSPRVVSWLDPARGVGMPGPGREPRTHPTTYAANLRWLAQQARERGAQPAFLTCRQPSQPASSWCKARLEIDSP